MADKPDDVTQSFILVMKMLAEARLEIEALKVVLEAHGVTPEEVAVARAGLKAQWDAAGDAAVEEIRTRRSAAALRAVLESATGTKQ